MMDSVPVKQERYAAKRVEKVGRGATRNVPSKSFVQAVPQIRVDSATRNLMATQC